LTYRLARQSIASKIPDFSKTILRVRGALRTVIARFGRSGATASRDWFYVFGGAKNGQSEPAKRANRPLILGAIWKDLKELHSLFADRLDFGTILKRSRGNYGGDRTAKLRRAPSQKRQLDRGCGPLKSA
jgi:hypothetical protein